MATVVKELVTRYKLEVVGEGKTQRALAATAAASDRASRASKKLTPLARGWDTGGKLGRLSRSVDESAQEMFDRGWSGAGVRRRASRIDALDAARAGGWVPRRQRGGPPAAGGGILPIAPGIPGGGRPSTNGRGGAASRIGSAFGIGGGIPGASLLAGGMQAGGLALGGGIAVAAVVGKLAAAMPTVNKFFAGLNEGFAEVGRQLDERIFGRDIKGEERNATIEAMDRENRRRGDPAGLPGERQAFKDAEAARQLPGRQKLDREKAIAGESASLDAERFALTDPAGEELRRKRADLEAFKLSQRPKKFEPMAQRQGELGRMIFGGGDLGAMGITPTELGGIKNPPGGGRRIATTGLRGVQGALDRLGAEIAKELARASHEAMRDVASSGARS